MPGEETSLRFVAACKADRQQLNPITLLCWHCAGDTTCEWSPAERFISWAEVIKTSTSPSLEMQSVSLSHCP